MRNDASNASLSTGTRTAHTVDLLELILGQVSSRVSCLQSIRKALGGKIRSWLIARYLMWAPWLRGMPGWSIRLRHHNPGDLAKEILERITKVRNHDAFHEQQVLRAFGSGEHLAERDWVIGSEVKGVKKSHTRTPQAKAKSSPGVSRGQDAKPQPGGRTQDFRVTGQTRIPVCLAQRLNSAKLCRGGFVHLLAHQKRWPPDSYRTVTICRATCDGGSAGVSECEK
jgi:hypothetical protein